MISPDNLAFSLIEKYHLTYFSTLLESELNKWEI